MTTIINQSRVRFTREEETGRIGIEVAALSVKNTKVKATHNIFPGDPFARTPEEILKKVGIAGAACAEYLGKKYGEYMDPGRCENDSKKAFVEECKRHGAVQGSAKSKLGMARQRAFMLPDAHRQSVELLWKLYNANSGQLTEFEINYLDQIIGRVFDL